jgi:lycopene beta-cyclase
MHHFDIILAGGGLSGLTLAIELGKRDFFQNKSILIIERDAKQQNDRTWCFWATEAEDLPPVLFRSWDHCLFYGAQGEKRLKMPPFRYHMVRGIDFYNWAAAEIAQFPNIQRIQAEILNLEEKGAVHTDQGVFTAEWVFNSAITPTELVPKASALYPKPAFSIPNAPQEKTKAHTWFLQHFKGWIIETPLPRFDTNTATLMDFRIDQKGDTRFVYVLPFSETKALVEYTVFSPALCTAAEYQAELQHYVQHFLKIDEFNVVEEEFGVIPMTDFGFSPAQQGKIIHIGTAGGFVKGSSGYAFKRTRRKLQQFTEAWARTGTPNMRLLRSSYRFRLYDSIMLRVLRDQLYPGKAFFSKLFYKRPAPIIFRFLDEDSTFTEDLRVIASPPPLPFLRALWLQLPFLKTL